MTFASYQERSPIRINIVPRLKNYHKGLVKIITYLKITHD